jgi:hypothetical protein
MRRSVIAGLALWAAFAGKTHAEVNYPWCIIGNARAVDCYFTSREQCMQDGRNRGFGGQCIQNPAYKPGRPTVSIKEPTASQSTLPSQAASAATTCTGLKLLCRSGGVRRPCFGSAEGGLACGGCDWARERCMKTGWWEAFHGGRQAERR